MLKVCTVRMDIKGTLVVRPYAWFTRGDIYTNQLLIRLRDDAIPFDISDADVAQFTFQKPSGMIVVGYGLIDDDPTTGIVRYTLGTQELVETGRILCTVSLLNAEGDKLTSNRFEFRCQAELDSTPAEISTSVGSYEERISDLELDSTLLFSSLLELETIVNDNSILVASYEDRVYDLELDSTVVHDSIEALEQAVADLEGQSSAGYTQRCILTVTGVVASNTVLLTNANSINVIKTEDSVALGNNNVEFNTPEILVVYNGSIMQNGVEVAYVTEYSFTLPTYTLDAGDIIMVIK